MSRFGTAATGNAASDVFVADVDDLGFNAFCVEGAGHLGQGGVSAAVLIRAAVDEENVRLFHCVFSGFQKWDNFNVEGV